MEHPQQLEHIPVPQLVPKTGLSENWLNEIDQLQMIASSCKHQEDFIKILHDIAEEERRGICRKYEERFPSDRFLDVVTDQNRDGVARLNVLAEEVNHLYEQGTLSYELLVEKTALARRIIHGEE